MDGRPLHNDRDDQAEAIRQVPYLAGFRRHRDKGRGNLCTGYVAEDDDPAFVVLCNDLQHDDREQQEQGYAAALTTAGYLVEPDNEDDDGGLRVWPPGQRPPPPPTIEPHELLGDSITALAIFG